MIGQIKLFQEYLREHAWDRIEQQFVIMKRSEDSFRKELRQKLSSEQQIELEELFTNTVKKYSQR